MTTIKLSDWVARRLADEGLRQVFMLTGGGAMHLNHSLGTEPRLSCLFMHHEQALTIAAEAYCRLTNRLAVVNVTSGPGGTNAITGVYGAFVDSIGMLVLSGQVKIETTVRSTGMELRQFGDQELDIERLVKPITKYAVMVTDTQTIRYHLEKALYLATSGRPGPCWIDIPLDVQAAQIDPDMLDGFDPAELEEDWRATDLPVATAAVVKQLKLAKRPVILAGAGVRLSGAHSDFLKLVERWGVPVVSGWNAHDVIWSDHPLFAGRPGTVGDRAGNFVVQNADFLLILGSRLNIRQVSYNWSTFARDAFKAWVDIDPLELAKPSVNVDLPIVADLKDFLPALIAATTDDPSAEHRNWLSWALERRKRYPAVQPEYRHRDDKLHPYLALDTVFRGLAEDDVVVTGNGSACVVGFQTAMIRRGQRLWTNSGCATMGYDLPAAIGAYLGRGTGERVICITGDGSIMMNLQELQTIAGHRLPIKVFLLNNGGYVSVFQTQRSFFGDVEVGGGPSSDVTFPDFAAVGRAFGFSVLRADAHSDLEVLVAEALATDGPVICELMIDGEVPFMPKLGARQHADGRITSPPLEDMSPFLSREELQANMIIDLIDK